MFIWENGILNNEHSHAFAEVDIAEAAITCKYENRHLNNSNLMMLICCMNDN